MARKQNYSYLKFQRDSTKAAKREAKKEQRAAGDEEPTGEPETPEDLEAILDALVPGGRTDDSAEK
ncbi:MAG: hypothetical protein DWI58_09640 [Chloroflexi bacterium]|nr:MAG: hypothetical protein DWI58_09640 [Chloroflexota bacterium]